MHKEIILKKWLTKPLFYIIMILSNKIKKGKKMRMTIDEATLYMELYKRKLFDSVSDLDKDIEAYDIAIDTMCKYQKIKQIIIDWENSGEEDDPINIIDNIEEVIEDGNDD